MTEHIILERDADFSTALMLCKAGYRIRRSVWAQTYVAAQLPDEGSKNTEPYLYQMVEHNRVPWVPSQLDLFAKDWIIYQVVHE